MGADRQKFFMGLSFETGSVMILVLVFTSYSSSWQYFEAPTTRAVSIHPTRRNTESRSGTQKIRERDEQIVCCIFVLLDLGDGGAAAGVVGAIGKSSGRVQYWPVGCIGRHGQRAATADSVMVALRTTTEDRIVRNGVDLYAVMPASWRRFACC
jgi:hypothetical protein